MMQDVHGLTLTRTPQQVSGQKIIVSVQLSFSGACYTTDLTCQHGCIRARLQMGCAAAAHQHPDPGLS